MAAFLDRSLAFRSPLVIGYAGWQGDVIMQALRRRLDGGTLPYRLYWFCYRHDEWKQLPEWLVAHPDVRVVLPKEAPRDGGVDAERTGPERSTSDELLPAQGTIEAITRAFDVREPELTRDPLAFFIGQLRSAWGSAPDVKSETGGDRDVYSLGAVIARIEHAAILLGRAEGEDGVGATGLARFRQAIRTSQYRDALKAATELLSAGLGIPECRELYEGLRGMQDQEHLGEADQLALSDLVLDLLSRLSAEISASEALKGRRSALMNKGEALRRLDRNEEALAAFDLVIVDAQSREQKSPRDRDASECDLTHAMSRKAITLGDAARHEDAVDLYGSVIDRASREGVKWLLAQAMFNRANELSTLGRESDARAAYHEFAERFRSATDGWTQVLLAAAAASEAVLLIEKGRASEGIPLVENIVTHEIRSRVVERG